MATTATAQPVVSKTEHTTTATAQAILAGGCFWCVESDMLKLAGVISATSGYTGGTIANPTYENYHHPKAGEQPHVEAVQITYNPAKLEYKALLEYYVRHIDPTDNGGQFCDRGAAYRPVIFTANEAEKTIVQQVLAAAEKQLKQKVNVDVLPATTFWPAEDYHQNYHHKNPTKYKFYRWNCGRDQRVQQLWGNIK